MSAGTDGRRDTDTAGFTSESRDWPDPETGREDATPGEIPGDPADSPGPTTDEDRGSTGGGLLKSSALMAAGTVFSKASGFIAKSLMVWAIGTSVLADTYQLGNTLPNMLYTLIIGGTLNAVFVPQLVRAMRKDQDGGEAYANRLLTMVGTAMLLLSVVTVLAAPWVVRLVATSQYEGGDNQIHFEHTVMFARYCLPQVFFYGLYVMLGQVLNARGRFGAMMWTPVLNNVVLMFTFGLFIAVSGRDIGQLSQNITEAEIQLLGIGTTLGIVVQALTLVPFVRASGFRIRPRFDWRGVGLRKEAGLAKWMLFLVLVNQLGYVVVTKVASAAGVMGEDAGVGYGVGLAPYANANIMFQLPHSIITVSLMTALMPALSRAVADGRLADARDNLSESLRTAGVAIVPAAAFYILFGPALAMVLFFKVDADSAFYIGQIVAIFAAGLIPFSTHYVVVRTFYAFEDTRTPFLISLVIQAVNVAGALASQLLPVQWITLGLAGSFSLSYVAGLTASTLLLRRRMGSLDGARIVRTYIRLGVAAGAGAVAAFGAAYLVRLGLGADRLSAVVQVVVGGVVLFGCYLVVAHRMRVRELQAMISMARSKIGR